MIINAWVFRNNIVSGIHPTFDGWEDIMERSRRNEKWMSSTVMLVSACEIADLIIATLTLCVSCTFCAGLMASHHLRHSSRWPALYTSVNKSEYHVLSRGRREKMEQEPWGGNRQQNSFLFSFRKNLLTYFIGCGKSFLENQLVFTRRLAILLQEGSGFKPVGWLNVTFSCSLCANVGFFQVLCSPPTAQKHAKLPYVWKWIAIHLCVSFEIHLSAHGVPHLWLEVNGIDSCYL